LRFDYAADLQPQGCFIVNYYHTKCAIINDCDHQNNTGLFLMHKTSHSMSSHEMSNLH